MKLRPDLLQILILTTLQITVSSCGLLIGNVKPVDEKADNYKILDLATQKDSPWLKLESTDDSKPVEKSELSDVSYQSNKTNSIISLNTGCRNNQNIKNQTLEEFTHLLFLGISDIELNEQNNTQIQGVPALQTTIKGKLSNEPTTVRAVVLKHEECFYDLMYVSKPEHFESEIEYFARFAASLRLK